MINAPRLALLQLSRQFRLEWTLYARDRVAMFWAFAFPALMLLGFGTIFRSGATPTLTLVVAGEARTQAGQDLVRALERGPVRLLRLDPAAAEARWRKGETAAQLEPGEPGPRLKVNTYLAAQGQLTAQIVQQAQLAAQLRRDGREPALLPVLTETPGNGHAANYAAFLLPGLLGLNILTMGLFGVGMINVSYREKGKFRRLAVTPLPKWIFLMGQVLHRLSVTFLQSALMLLLGWSVFGIANQGSYLLLGLVMTLGTACFMTMGFALAGFAQITESYAAVSNVCFFPMMFLSGVYFTLDSAPSWLRQAVVVLPLSPWLRTMRGIFNDGAGMAGQWAGLAVVAGWTGLCFLVALKRFKWA
jgi:ABC-type multidrug transport system permease subunit